MYAVISIIICIVGVSMPSIGKYLKLDYLNRDMKGRYKSRGARTVKKTRRIKKIPTVTKRYIPVKRGNQIIKYILIRG